MTEPMEPHNPWWLRLTHWLWRQQSFVWTSMILGVALNIFASWLTTSEGAIFSNTPLGTILGHPLIPSLLGIGLLLVTGILWLINRLNPASPYQHMPANPPTQRDREVLIHLLRQDYTRRWTHSLQEATMIALELHERTDITRSSAQLVFRRTEEERAFPPGTSIAQVYDEASHGLLIVGAPGTGKTTLLLELAQELLSRSESKPALPIPVILNLSSWARNKPLLENWIIDQLQLVYAIPSHLSRSGLEQDQWLLLLDGLDEVSASARNECIGAINNYRGSHIAPLVVCSRTLEYLTQEQQLALPTAIEIQQLESSQITEYLKGVGKSMTAIRAVLRSNPILQHVIRTPLMLNVIILTYRDKAIEDLPQMGSVKEQQDQIFKHYVQRMLEKRMDASRFSAYQTQFWLIWLARQMKQHSLTEFYFERLQLDWLPKKQLQVLHKWLVGLTIGLVVGLLNGLVDRPSVGLIDRLISGLIFGLIFGLIGGLANDRIQPAEKLTWKWKAPLRGLRNGMAVGLFIGLLVGTIGLLIGLIGGLDFFGFVSDLIVALIVAVSFGLPLGLIFGAIGGLVSGLSPAPIDEQMRLRPNQGILSSGKNALRVGVTSSLVFALVGGLLSGLPFALVNGLLSGLPFALVDGLLSGFLNGFLFSQAFGLKFGGRVYIQHYILRFLLWRCGVIPWHYVRFLEEATKCILLQRVGGGYRFIHPLFLDYFASLEDISIPHEESPQPSSPQP